MSDEYISDDTTTTGLFRALGSGMAFDEYIAAHPQRTITLASALNELCASRGLVRERVINAAGIERTYGHQVFRGIRHPSRDKVIQLALGLGLNVKETQRLLRIADKPPLYPRILRDAILIHCIEHKLTCARTQCELHARGATPLGEGK